MPLDPRALLFLTGSDELDGLPPIDYARLSPAELEGGHPGALADARRLAREQALVGMTDVRRWHVLLARAQPGALPPALDALMADLHLALPGLIAEPNQVALIALAGDVLHRFAGTQVFGAAHGRLGRLLGSYLLTLYGQPLPVFRPSEREAYQAAHATTGAMRCYLAEKAREAMVSMSGETWERSARFESADRYTSPDGRESMLLECHDLARAQEDWATR